MVAGVPATWQLRFLSSFKAVSFTWSGEWKASRASCLAAAKASARSSKHLEKYVGADKGHNLINEIYSKFTCPKSGNLHNKCPLIDSHANPSCHAHPRALLHEDQFQTENTTAADFCDAKVTNHDMREAGKDIAVFSPGIAHSSALWKKCHSMVLQEGSGLGLARVM